MKSRFLLILLAAAGLAGCSALGLAKPNTVVIVVTATPAPASISANQPAATLPATLPPAAQPVNTTAPAPAAAPTNTQAAAVPANPTPNAQVPATGPAVQISVKQLLDYNVVDSSGSPLGEMKDLVINRPAAGSGAANSGEIPYLVVKSGLREDWYIPVPWKSAQFRPDLQAVVLPVTAAQFMNAPGFSKDFWPASFAAQQAVLQNYWANPGAAAAAAAPLNQAGGALQAADYLRGDDLLSVDFINQQGQKLGEIKDLAIDWQNSQPGSAQAGKFSYVIVELDDSLSMNNVMVPVPWRLVNLAPGQKDMQVNFTPNLLQTAPNFAKGILPNVYAEPLNSQLNAFWSGK